jgi:putative tricarboxylic transport membrane protein
MTRSGQCGALNKGTLMSVGRRNGLRRLGAIAVAGLSVCAGSDPASTQSAQWEPQKNVELIVPTAAGSSMDLLARLVQEILRRDNLVKTPITVQARSGGGGAVAWTYLSRKTGDGHFLAISGPTLLANELLGVGDLSWRDVTPIAQLFTEYVVFTVRPDGPIRTGADLVAALKRPVPPAVGIAPGLGGSNHVAFIKLARALQLDPSKLVAVPFKGANEAINALLGGHIDAAPATMSVVAPFLEAGTLRAIAIAAPRRLEGSQSLVPTWREQGVDVVEGNWRGVVGPKNLGAAEAAYWDSRLGAVVKTSDWADSLKRFYWDADYADSAGARRFLDARFEELRATLATLSLAK